MKKVKLIIFSMNRAAQLRLLLSSLARNSNYLFDITIIFKWTSEPFKLGYDKLFDEVYSSDEENEFAPLLPVVFLPEDERGFAYTLDYELNQKAPHELLAFTTDDCILYRPIECGYNVLQDIVTQPGIASFSLRTGMDTTIETYYKGNRAPVPQYFEFEQYQDVVFWNHKLHNPNSCRGYTNSVDLHIFDKEYICNLIQKVDHNNPNQLEGNIANFSHRSELPAYTASFTKQHALACPVNQVAGWNSAGSFYPVSVEALNERYLNGEVIDVDAAIKDCLDIKDACTHNEIKYQFIKV